MASCGINSSGFVILTEMFPSLHILDVSKNDIGSGFEQIEKSGMKDLRILLAVSTRMTADGFANIYKRFPSLIWINVWNNPLGLLGAAIENLDPNPDQNLRIGVCWKNIDDIDRFEKFCNDNNYIIEYREPH